MRALLPAPLPARITTVTHGPAASPVRQHQPLAASDHGDADDARAALPRGGFSGRSAGPIGFFERKKFDCAKISDFVFEFDRSNAKTRCFANFLDVR